MSNRRYKIITDKKGIEKEDVDKKVKTIDGILLELSKCVVCNGNYFPTGDDRICKDYFIDTESKYNPYLEKKRSIPFYLSLNKDNTDIDESTIQYTHNSNAIRLVYVFSPDKSAELAFYGHQILLDAGYVECLETGMFFPSKYRTKAKTTKTGKFRQVDATKSFDKDNMIHNHKFGLSSSTYSISEGKRYSMGIELETSFGHLPRYLDEHLNYECVKDGSLRDANGDLWGGEYVTGVLTGDMGFKQLKTLCNELTKRCSIDKRCGVHTHLGGIEFNKEFIVYLYYLARKIETELFSMLPHSRRNNQYCRPLKKLNIVFNKGLDSKQEYNDFIENVYNEILLYISFQDKLDPTVVNKSNDHPLGAKCGYNHSTARYAWLNFVPAIFNTRNNGVYTIEIRNHHGSLNYMKIRNWTLLFMGMCHVVENHKQFLRENKTISLSDIIRLSYPKKADELIKYVEERKLKFLNKEDSKYEEESEYSEELKDNNVNLKSL